MNNVYEIKPKTIEQLGHPKRTAVAVNICCADFSPFVGASARVELIDDEGETIAAGNVSLSKKQFDAWESDDDVFIQAVAENAGVEITGKRETDPRKIKAIAEKLAQREADLKKEAEAREKDRKAEEEPRAATNRRR